MDWGRPRRARLLIAVAATAVTGLVGATSAASGASERNQPINSVISSSAKAAHQGLPNFDVRRAEVATTPARTVAAQAKLRSSLGSGAVLETDPATGAVRSLGRLDGFLTGPSDHPARQIALDYIRTHHAAFGISSAAVGSLRPFSQFADSSGNHHLSFVQTVGGIPVFGAGLKANITRHGQLINVVDGPAPNTGVRTTAPSIDAGQAVSAALRNGNADSASPGRVNRSGNGAEELTTFSRGNRASLVIFPTASGGRLAWQVNANATSTGTYIDVVDAQTGKVLHRQNQVDFDSTATGQAWQYYPSNIFPIPGGSSNADIGTQGTQSFPVDNSGSRLSGNNAHAYADVNDNIVVPGGSVPSTAEIPSSSGLNWNYPAALDDGSGSGPFGGFFANCDPNWKCTWDSGVANSWQTNLKQNATQVYYYVNNFHNFLMNDSDIGFTPAAGNFQADGGDAVQAQVDDGANTAPGGGFPDGHHQVNANMATQQDGIPPRMQMYLFPAYGLNFGAPDANGGDDASVIYHEYTHGLSSRLVTQPNGVPGLGAFQSGSMGEAWSDWYAMDYLMQKGYDVDTSTPGDVQVGFFVGGGTTIPLRSEPMDCPANGTDSGGACPGGSSTGPGGYTLGDMGKIIGQPEVHADGEIWGQTLWQIRQALGNNVAERIITQGMELSPATPSMLDMRNAILQADKASRGGADLNTLWSVFANRGMGYFASDDGPNDTTPTENFSTPPNCSAIQCGTLTGKVLDGNTLKPVVGARVAIKGTGDLVATTNAAGQYAMTNIPPHNSYPSLTVSKAGYTPVTQQSIVVNAGTQTRNFTIRRDWADTGLGAVVTKFSPPDYSSFGCGPKGGFDLSQVSGWGSTSISPQDPSNGPGGQKSATVRLPKAIDLSGLAVDPGATCGDDDTASTKGLKIETSPNGTTFTTVANTTFSAAQAHEMNNVTPTSKPKKVKFLRVTMLSNQNPSSNAGRNFMDLSEVAIYGKPSDVTKPVIGSATIVPGQTVRSTIANGFKISSHLSEAGNEKGTLQITATKAQQLGIPRTIGTGTLAFAAAATKRMTMNLTATAKNKLKNQSSLAVTATLNATDRAGNKATPVSRSKILPH